MTGASIGVVGTTLGTLLGLIFCWNIDSIKQLIETMSGAELFAAEIYFLSNLPARIDLQDIFMVILMALVCHFLLASTLLGGHHALPRLRRYAMSEALLSRSAHNHFFN